MSSLSADPSTNADQVADHIRADIVAGDLVPNQRLVEVELSERYGASRGAVRSALLQLDVEGLVERVANRGARVRAVTTEEAIAITEVRMVVEGLCAAKAAEKVTQADAERFREIGRGMQEAVRTGAILDYSALNRALHDLIREVAAQPVATEVMNSLLARNVRAQFKLAMRPGRPQVSLPEHLAIIDEICAGSPEGAERAIRRHISSVIEALRNTP